jgi:hypothetical protein
VAEVGEVVEVEGWAAEVEVEVVVPVAMEEVVAAAAAAEEEEEEVVVVGLAVEEVNPKISTGTLSPAAR